MQPDDLTAYLDRLGLPPEPPSAEALARLHRAHVERVAYETVWIQLGEHRPIDLASSVSLISRTRRGGYCYHLNGAFSVLLGALGYDVSRHVGGVHHAGGGPQPDWMTNHLALQVRGLPTETNPGGGWYLDVGLGDALHGPLPLVQGKYVVGPFTLTLERTDGTVGDWHLIHDEHGAFGGMAWWSAEAEMDEFEGRHLWLSTQPESGFVRVLTAQRRFEHHVDVLKGLVLRRVGAGAGESTITSRTELLDALHDVFALDLAAVDDGRIKSMWMTLKAAHETWESQGRP